jgi:dihydroorotate dehydrogenase electron transfer subunit
MSREDVPFPRQRIVLERTLPQEAVERAQWATFLPRTYPISAIKEETEHVKTFTFPVSFGAKPGQFLMVWLPGVDEVPMSVALDDGELTKITFFDIGDATQALFRCRVGDLVGLRGPYGTHYEWDPGQHLCLIAGGYGAAPLYFVAVESIKDGCTIDFIIGARSREHLLYVEEVEKLQSTKLHISTDDGSMGFKGRNTEVLEQLLTARRLSAAARPRRDGPLTAVFACGPELMLKRISAICSEQSIRCAMSLERYMKCGYGLCGNCVMDPLGIRLCIDGPVVQNDLCQRLTEFGKYHRDDLGRKHAF